MIIQRAGVFRFLRYVGIFCAITMGFFSIVATSEDDVEDAAAFDKDLDVASITVTDAQLQSTYKNCEQEISLNGLADDAGVDISNIKSVKLNGLKARYQNVILNPEVDDFSCTVTITQVNPAGDNDTKLPDINVKVGSSEWGGVALTDDNLSVINYYLANRDSSFDICAVCTDDLTPVESFSATIEVRFDVEITPDL